MKDSAKNHSTICSPQEYVFKPIPIPVGLPSETFAEEWPSIERQVVEKFRGQRSLGFQLAIKRLIDIVGSLVLIIILSPVLLLTALAVRFTSPGPIFFSQKRWGLNESHFLCLKFRSMRIDQGKVVNLTEIREMEKKGILYKPKKDPRLNLIGAFIRKTSIDELPQLFNVVRGDMSLVGPRPLVMYMLDPYPEIRNIRCMMRPGITGLWQISDREDNTSAAGMLPHDLDYLLHFSLWIDLKIMLVTPAAVLGGDGAC